MKFKIGDILISKKTSIPIPHNSSDWVPCINMIQGSKYIVVGVDDDDIHMAMESRFLEPGMLKYWEQEFFGFDIRRVNHWERWFYTKMELREMKLKELGI
jgi:hypothetical protein